MLTALDITHPFTVLASVETEITAVVQHIAGPPAAVQAQRADLGSLGAPRVAAGSLFGPDPVPYSRPPAAAAAARSS